jgi:hypothetical protein
VEEDTIGDRVFICIGKNKETEQRAIWIMTLSLNFDEVTFWEINQPIKYKMHGRILNGEDKNLKAYLFPNVDDKERKEIVSLKEKKIK